ncbi:ricin-type beta-trefoil lectin domain protein [Actinoplanes derwentensis]|uniref:Glucosylceramidase n=1 Tax=Actinoplanes derwentensis TaxID=113562 RepID=A0A1H1XI01_9ACTN|nr:ricin-type beta-trefoil lectin domain protein [Actinoplanes derwentensis]GID87178.1 glucosylceramidase [Actinoplanes derwentensis]SDT08346.1 glucosylceramidase [Actinoplanes derwentensis]
MSCSPIDGFGFSEHFGRATIMHGSEGLSAQRQREVLDLLLSRTSGAGLSILRLGIGSAGKTSIQPTDPGGPGATPRYVWNGDDDGQVWLAQQAKAYGVNRFYADAWSAPGYMKTNGDESNGGTLCGLSGTACGSGDWRRAYANYLVQYARFYAQEGITINDLGFTNEPDYTTSYSSMRFTPAQAVELTKIVGPIAGAAGLKVACCDAVGWTSQGPFTAAIAADAEAHSWITTHTGHSYSSAPTAPLPVSGRRTWMSEWSPSGTTWNESWDDGSGYDGFTVAQAVHTALTSGNVNGYVYWYGASTGTTRGLVQLDGDGYRTSKRLWALASYSRFIRPNATRIGASTPDGNLRLSAYQNTDGSLVLVALNASSSATEVSYALPNTGVTSGTATPYLTNGVNSMAVQPAVAVTGGAFTAAVPARSLITYRITGQGTTGRIRSEAASRCADVPNSSNANGTRLQVWDCNSNANQRWTLTGGELRVLGKCLDAPLGSTAAGTPAQLWECSGNPNQQWTVNANGTISNLAYGLCLDLNGGATANGTAMVMSTCNTGAGQRWARI